MKVKFLPSEQVFFFLYKFKAEISLLSPCERIVSYNYPFTTLATTPIDSQRFERTQDTQLAYPSRQVHRARCT